MAWNPASFEYNVLTKFPSWEWRPFLFVKYIFRFPFVKEICLIKPMFLCMYTLTIDSMLFIYIFVKQPSKSQGRREAFKALGLHSARYLNLRKAATCSHSQPLEWPQVAASGRFSRVAASGRLYHITPWIRNWEKQPTRSRRQPTYPSQLEKKHTFPTKHIFSRCSKTIAKKQSLTSTKTGKNTQSQPIHLNLKKKHLSNKTSFIKMFIGKEEERLDTSLSSKGQA